RRWRRGRGEHAGNVAGGGRRFEMRVNRRWRRGRGEEAGNVAGGRRRGGDRRTRGSDSLFHFFYADGHIRARQTIGVRRRRVVDRGFVENKGVLGFVWYRRFLHQQESLI